MVGGWIDNPDGYLAILLSPGISDLHDLHRGSCVLVVTCLAPALRYGAALARGHSPSELSQRERCPGGGGGGEGEGRCVLLFAVCQRQSRKHVTSTSHHDVSKNAFLSTSCRRHNEGKVPIDGLRPIHQHRNNDGGVGDRATPLAPRPGSPPPGPDNEDSERFELN
jgi:hypothetical protein